ncbi:hypothetical protein PENSPDRAFT_739676 [Peniophora sp. CONT]|nr:hypothetical protein PENSPDRAFT_739676 [Peniophora sp. CONT]
MSLFARRRALQGDNEPQRALSTGSVYSENTQGWDSTSSFARGSSTHIGDTPTPLSLLPPVSSANVQQNGKVRRSVSGLAKRLAFTRPAASFRGRQPLPPPSRSPSPSFDSDIRRPSGLGRSRSYDSSTGVPRGTDGIPEGREADANLPRFPRAYPLEEEKMPIRRAASKQKLRARSPIGKGGYGFGVEDDVGTSAQTSTTTDSLSLPYARSHYASSTPILDAYSSRSASPAPHGGTSSPATSPAPSPLPSDKDKEWRDKEREKRKAKVMAAFPLPPPSPSHLTARLSMAATDGNGGGRPSFAAESIYVRSSMAAENDSHLSPTIARAMRVPIPTSPNSRPAALSISTRERMLSTPSPHESQASTPTTSRGRLLSTPSNIYSTSSLAVESGEHDQPPATPPKDRAHPLMPQLASPASTPLPMPEVQPTPVPAPVRSPVPRARKRLARQNPPVPLSLLFAHIPRRDLPSLARVNKRFCASARAALYTHIVLPLPPSHLPALTVNVTSHSRDGSGAEGEVIPVGGDEEDDDDSDRTDALLARLALSPHLTSLIESFALLTPPGNAQPGGTFDAALALALRGMVRMRTLRVPRIPGAVCEAGFGFKVPKDGIVRVDGQTVPEGFWKVLAGAVGGDRDESREGRLKRLELPHVRDVCSPTDEGVRDGAIGLQELVAQPAVVTKIARACGSRLRRVEMHVESTLYEGLRPGDAFKSLAEAGSFLGSSQNGENGPGLEELVLVFARNIDGRTRGRVVAAIGRETDIARRLKTLEVRVEGGARERDADEILFRQLTLLLPQMPALVDLRLPPPPPLTTPASATFPSPSHAGFNLPQPELSAEELRYSMDAAIMALGSDAAFLASLGSRSTSPPPRTSASASRPSSARAGEGTPPPSAEFGVLGPGAAAQRIAQWSRLAPGLKNVSLGGARYAPVVRQEIDWAPVAAP